MNLISTQEAADRKGVSRQAIVNAIKRKDIDGQQVSARTLVVTDNAKFEKWQPNPIRRAAGLANRDKQRC